MMENPNFSYTGYLPNGNRVTFNFPIENFMSAVAFAVEITNNLTHQGFTATQPGLTEGEDREAIVTVMRRAKPADDTIIIDFYPEWGAGNDEPFGTYKYLHIYMDKDKPEMIAEFLKFSGFKRIEDIPLYDAQASLKRTPNKKHPKETAVPTPFKIVKKQGTEKTGSDGKVFRPWEFVRYEALTTPQPTATPQPATAPASKAEAVATSSVAALNNEELTITRIEPRGDRQGWYGFGDFFDGIMQHEVRVHIFAPEDVKLITDGGHSWSDKGGNVNYTVILKEDRNMLRIASITPKASENAAKETVDSFVVNLTQANKPYLIFKYGDNYAYSYTREPFRKAGYDVTGWDIVGNHEMPTPAEIVVQFDKQQKRLIVQSVSMVDVFAKQVAS